MTPDRDPSSPAPSTFRRTFVRVMLVELVVLVLLGLVQILYNM